MSIRTRGGAKRPPPFTNLPPEKYPLRIELLHPSTREVVWSDTVEMPAPGRRARVEIPPMARQLGHPVAVRMTFGDGEVVEEEPATLQS